MLSFLTRPRSKFLLSIGDDGAVLVYMVGKQMEGRFFFAEPESTELERVLGTDPDAPIHIFADVSDQSYTPAALPPVSALNIQKLVQRRLFKDFDKNDIKGALLIERSKTGRRDWNYMFVSLRSAPPFSTWIETLVRQENRIAGIYPLPVEAEQFIRDVKKAIVAENVVKPSVWQMMITHNKVGGLRQVILKNGRITFTRMAQPVGGTSPGVVAGNIEQEALNTVEFMRRLGYEPEAGLDIIIITAAEVKRQLEPSRFQATNVFVMTPHEIAGQLGLEKTTEPKDKFADVVMLAYFGQHRKRILKLTTPLLTRIEQLTLARMALRYLPVVLVPLALLLGVVNLYGGYTLQDDIKRAEDEMARASANLKRVQSRNDGLAQRKKEVTNLLEISDMLNKEAIAPFNFLQQVEQMKGPDAFASELRFVVQLSTDKTTKKTSNMLAASFSMDLLNRSETPQAYLLEAKKLRSRFEEAMKGMTVAFSGLPGEQDFKMTLAAGEAETGIISGEPQQAAPPPKDASVRLTISGPLPPDVQERYFTLPEKEQPGQPRFVPVVGDTQKIPPIPPVGGKK